MTRFTASTQSSADLASSRQEVWAALTDPELLPRLTPYLQRIEVDGDRWTWHMTRVPLLGASFQISFTELMGFSEPEGITFTHDPRATEENTGVNGAYELQERGSGCRVAIDLGVDIDLPFPSLTRPAVETGMKTVMYGIGRRFSGNLLRHLGER